jgi:POT family proton-dependent oligopeptide transporter
MSLPTKHPKEMYSLALIEMCQRFAFWGIGNLLVLYLVQFYQFSDIKATHLYGVFSGIAFVLPLLGGYIADRTSYKWSVILGSLTTAAGCFFITFGLIHFLYLALALAAIGASIFTPSIYTLLGTLYKDKHHLREGGFSIYYSAVNLGVFLATLTLGAIGESNHWTLAFIIAGCVQLCGLFLFFRLMKKKSFADLHSENHHLNFKASPTPLKKSEKDRIIVISILALFSILFWMAYNQGWSSMSLFALRYTKHVIGTITVPSSLLLSLESLYLILLAYPLSWAYLWLAKRKLNPSPPMKTALSLVAMGICFVLMMIGSREIPEGQTTGSISPFYLVYAYGFMAVAEMLLAPIGLSLVTHLSPHRYTAFLVGVWYVCIGIAFYAGGMIAGFMSSMKHISNFFDIFVIASFVPAILLFLMAKWLNKMRHADKF